MHVRAHTPLYSQKVEDPNPMYILKHIVTNSPPSMHPYAIVQSIKCTPEDDSIHEHVMHGSKPTCEGIARYITLLMFGTCRS